MLNSCAKKAVVPQSEEFQTVVTCAYLFNHLLEFPLDVISCDLIKINPC